MRFKILVCSLLLLSPTIYAKDTLTESEIPLDLIELLGEMDDNDSALEVALSQVEQASNEDQKITKASKVENKSRLQEVTKNE